MNKLRLVIDTNVFISALLNFNSVPFSVIKIAFEKHILLGSAETVREIKRVLFRKKFDKYISNEERYAFLAKFLTTSQNVIIVERFNVCRDTKDNCFLNLAVNGKANFIITGDKDLLVLNPFQ
ncbi:putative toxin-antitoxin system toxin component, PIN family [Crocosphaera sp.]|uniref:putative toxin-antitoxin system toxin component, PIN family n=1 Tax=Crocosphaera sp. TaxID=2729996 RepID=UPI00260DF367|nr:putative toxin-antitoxin system toxin component, PIN family [Crocosphaera sp.]MDJ0578655.1 putative toxin-antitoxin system toxin component, PIN family [Crocosphaera sp.]